MTLSTLQTVPTRRISLEESLQDVRRHCAADGDQGSVDNHLAGARGGRVA